MAEYRLTPQAIQELKATFLFGLERFGVTQAIEYQNELEHVFTLLAENPRMGRQADRQNPALRQHVHVSHRVFYEVTPEGILILGVVHISSLRRPSEQS